MPYIDWKQREDLEAGGRPTDAGELNYAVTILVRRYLGRTPRYADYNEAVGALESAKLELYRRMVAPYEDEKIKQNGDVY